MRSGRSWRAVVLAAIVAAIVLAGCSRHASATHRATGHVGAPVRGGSLDIGLVGAPPSLDSALDVAAAGYVVARAIYDPLFQLARDGSLIPMLARGYHASADERTFTVTLRTGLEFSDGTSLSGAAVVAHYQRLLDTPAVSMPPPLRATRISAVGNVVTFVTPHPWSDFPAQVLASNIGLVGSAAAARADPAKYARDPVGAGPFMVASYVAGSEVTVVRNPHYWRHNLLYLNSITFRFLTDAQTRLASVESGSLEFIQSSDVAQRAPAQADGLHTQVNVGLGPVGILLNTADGPLADRRVRVALAQAIDTRAISQVVYHGLAPPAIGFAPPHSAAARGSATPRYDPAAAKAAIAAYGRPIHITLTVLAGTDFLDAAQLVQQMWQKVGVHVTIKQLAAANAVSTIFVKKDYQAYLSNNFNEGAPVSRAFVLFVKGAGTDPTNIDDPALNQAYADGLAAATPTARTAAWRRAEQRMAADVPAIPLVQKLGLFVWRNTVHGVPHADPHGVQMFDVASMWISH